jgi:hypothetical protein
VPSGSDFVFISAGDSHGVSINEGGELEAWGDDVESQLDVPIGNDYVEVIASQYFSVAMHADGTLEGWGRDSVGQATPPSGIFIDYALGRLWGVGVKKDGTLEVWGTSETGVNDIPQGDGFVSVGAGNMWGIAIDDTGRIWHWGEDGQGQDDVPSGTGWEYVDGHYYHGIALGMVDCNGNGIADATDIKKGTSIDENPADGIPDECQGLPVGGCCLSHGVCAKTTESDCEDAEGEWAGEEIFCDAAPCTEECPSDLDGDGEVNVTDLLEMFAAWGTCP